jgi:hypothetical protein
MMSDRSIESLLPLLAARPRRDAVTVAVAAAP